MLFSSVYLNQKSECSLDNNKKFRSFKSKENIHKKEVGPYRGFGIHVYTYIGDSNEYRHFLR